MESATYAIDKMRDDCQISKDFAIIFSDNEFPVGDTNLIFRNLSSAVTGIHLSIVIMISHLKRGYVLHFSSTLILPLVTSSFA